MLEDIPILQSLYIDALKILKIPIIELHISNIYNREDFRHKSLISNVAKELFVVLEKGYIMALRQ